MANRADHHMTRQTNDNITHEPRQACDMRGRETDGKEPGNMTKTSVKAKVFNL